VRLKRGIVCGNSASQSEEGQCWEQNFSGESKVILVKNLKNAINNQTAQEIAMVKVDFTIRPGEHLDRAVLKEIIDLSFPRFFRFFAANSVDSEDGKFLVSEFGGVVVGFAKLTEFSIDRHKYGCILWLAVHPNQRRKGVASALVQAGVEELKRDGAEAVFASVQRRNMASLATFGRDGFERVGFVSLWRRFGWRTFQFYSDIWFAPGEIVQMHS